MGNVFRIMYEGVRQLNDCIAHDSKFVGDAFEALESMEEFIDDMYGVKIKCKHNNFIIHTIIFYKNNEVLAQVRCQILQE